jgi:hypothetical protein
MLSKRRIRADGHLAGDGRGTRSGAQPVWLWPLGIAPGRDRGDAVVVGRIRPMAAHCAAGAAWANRQVPAIWQHAPRQTTYLWLRPSVPAALI